MPGGIGLVGGDEFRQGCEEMDRAIMGLSGQTPAQVLIVPTAQRQGPDKAASDGIRHFASLGAEASPVMVLDRAHASDPRYIQSLEGAGVIYLTGGSPDHLLYTLRDSDFFRAVLAAVEQGAVLAGSSAGAMVLGSWMRRPGNGEWVEGLGVVPGMAVLPHHENRNPAEVSRQLQGQAPDNITLLGIDARAGCIGGSGNWRVVGSGKVVVYQGDTWDVYNSGQQLTSEV